MGFGLSLGSSFGGSSVTGGTVTGSSFSSSFGGYSGIRETKCPEGWTLYRGLTRKLCYMFHDTAVDKTTAQKTCRGEGGTLLHFDSKVENTFFTNYVHHRTNGEHGVWLGINNRSKGKFNLSRNWLVDSNTRWGNRETNRGDIEEIPFSNWSNLSNMFEQRGESENDVAYFKASNGQWETTTEDDSNYFFCKRIPIYS